MGCTVGGTVGTLEVLNPTTIICTLGASISAGSGTSIVFSSMLNPQNSGPYAASFTL